MTGPHYQPGTGLIDGVIGRIRTEHTILPQTHEEFADRVRYEHVRIIEADQWIAVSPETLRLPRLGTRVPGFATAHGDGEVIVFRDHDGNCYTYRHVEGMLSQHTWEAYRQEEHTIGEPLAPVRLTLDGDPA